MIYQPTINQAVTMTLALDGDTKGHQLSVIDADVLGGKTISLSANEREQLVLHNPDTVGGIYDLEIKRASAEGEQTFRHGGIAVQATDSHLIDYGTWDGSGPMVLHIDRGSDGSIDETVELPNEHQGKWKVFLPIVMK